MCPIAAIRELVLNAVIHKDYLNSSDIQIKIFDQSITFYNPGLLYGKVTLEDLAKDTYTSELRNKLIAEAFYLTKDIEKYGTGFLRVRKELREYPTMKFQYREQGSGFVTELGYRAQKVSTVINEHKNEHKNEHENLHHDAAIRLKRILEIVGSNNKISMEKLARILDVSRITVIRDLNKLRDDGLIVRKGPKSGGSWDVI